VVIFPIAYLVTWGPFGAVLGMLIGSAVAVAVAFIKRPYFSRPHT